MSTSCVALYHNLHHPCGIARKTSDLVVFEDPERPTLSSFKPLGEFLSVAVKKGINYAGELYYPQLGDCSLYLCFVTCVSS